MRSAVLVAALGLCLALPARAQIAADLPGKPAPVSITETPGSASLSSLFSAQTLRLSHSYEYGYSAGAGGDLGMGIYTSTLRWQPSARLAARADIGVAHAAVGSLAGAAGFGPDQPARVFLRNAELAYRPTENSLLQLRVGQTPYGRACTYSCGSRYGAGYGGYTAYDQAPGGDLFWRTDLGGIGGGE